MSNRAVQCSLKEEKKEEDSNHLLQSGLQKHLAMVLECRPWLWNIEGSSGDRESRVFPKGGGKREEIRAGLDWTGRW